MNALQNNRPRRRKGQKPAGGVIYYAENAVALLNQAYFRRGVKRRYEELSALKKRPENLCVLIENAVSAEAAGSLKEALRVLMREVEASFQQAKKSVAQEEKTAVAEKLEGTYEEMYSNWRNKMILAASTGDRHLAFMSLSSLDAMLDEIGEAAGVGKYDAFQAYDPQDLNATARGFDAVLQDYLQEYRKADLPIRHYPDVDAFVSDYLK